MRSMAKRVVPVSVPFNRMPLTLMPLTLMPLTLMPLNFMPAWAGAAREATTRAAAAKEASLVNISSLLDFVCGGGMPSVDGRLLAPPRRRGQLQRRAGGCKAVHGRQKPSRLGHGGGAGFRAQ